MKRLSMLEIGSALDQKALHVTGRKQYVGSSQLNQGEGKGYRVALERARPLDIILSPKWGHLVSELGQDQTPGVNATPLECPILLFCSGLQHQSCNILPSDLILSVS